MIKKTSLIDRIKNAIRAFCCKPIGSIHYGVNITRCDECEFRKYRMPNWIFIEEGCQMPEQGDEVLITIWEDASYGKRTDICYHTDMGTYQTDGSGYLDTVIYGLGFDTYNDWDEGQPIKVIAWMPKPEPYVPVLTNWNKILEDISNAET